MRYIISVSTYMSLLALSEFLIDKPQCWIGLVEKKRMTLRSHGRGIISAFLYAFMLIKIYLQDLKSYEPIPMLK